VPAIIAAPFLLALLGKQPLGATLKRFRLLYALLAGGALLVLVAQVGRGRSLSDLLGAYSIVGERSYDPETVARFFFYHLAELDLYLGVIPFAAFLLLTALARRTDTVLAPFLAAGIALTISVLVVVAAFASEFANRIQERNTFVVAPFFLIALLVWVDRGLPRPRWTVLVAARRRCFRSRSPGSGSSRPERSRTRSPCCRSGMRTARCSSTRSTPRSSWGAFSPRRSSCSCRAAGRSHSPQPCCSSCSPSPTTSGSASTASGRPRWGRSSRGSASARGTGSTGPVPKDATVAFVWKGVTDRFAVNQNEFFNRRLGPIYYIGGPTPGGLAETEVVIDESTGEIRTAAGEPVDARYLITEDAVSPDGVVLARDPGIGLTLWRVTPPLVATATKIEGRYPGDTWSGRTVTWTRERCRGGTLTVSLSSDPQLFDTDQVVTASVAGNVVGRARIAPAGTAQLRVRPTPEGGTCRVVFRVAQTKVPGGGDDRELGAHFNTFDYRP
jgi:hypothetical protein